MKILGIDTSCDDTCAAVLDDNRVLSNIISSQIAVHKDWGGVVPNLARLEHEKNIDFVIETALKRARINIKGIELIAVTIGPGLSVALGVGIKKAKELAEKNRIKIIGVNHIEGHMLSVWLKNRHGNPKKSPAFPCLALTVSGGHTKIVKIKKIGSYEVLGETLDDAAGEALDKASKILGLGYPGGPVLERMAKKGNKKFFELPRPLTKPLNNLNFSFSGLKTSFYYKVKDWPLQKKIQNFPNLAACFQEAVFDTLIRKFRKAIEIYNPKSLIACGGVISNMDLRRKLRILASTSDLEINFPFKREFNTDNAAMIGLAGYFKYLKTNRADSLKDLERSPTLNL